MIDIPYIDTAPRKLEQYMIDEGVDPTKIPLDDPFIREVCEEIYYEKGVVLIIIVGRRGRGKSRVAIKIASGLNPAFLSEDADTIIRKRVIRSVRQLAELMNDTSIKRGDVIVFDEAGVGAGSREWYTKLNRNISKLIQIFRYTGVVLILTVPKMDLVDTHIRSDVNYSIEAVGINRTSCENIVHIKKWKISNREDDKNSKIYRKFLRNNKTGQPIKWMYFKNIPARLANAYENYSREFKDDIRREILDDIKDDQKKALEKKTTDMDIINKIIEDGTWKDMIIQHSGQPSVSLSRIQLKYDISYQKAVKIRHGVMIRLTENGELKRFDDGAGFDNDIPQEKEHKSEEEPKPIQKKKIDYDEMSDW